MGAVSDTFYQLNDKLSTKAYPCACHGCSPRRKLTVDKVYVDEGIALSDWQDMWKNYRWKRECPTPTQALRNYNNKENDMSTSVEQALRLKKLPEDDRLLIKAGLINVDGTLTAQGVRVTHNYAFEAHKAEIVADLKELKSKQTASESDDSK